MKIIAAKEFTLNGKRYKKGDEVKTPKICLIRLNEKGFVEPFNIKDLDNLEKENKSKKEEEK